MGRRRSVGTGATKGARSSSSLHAVAAALLALGLAACQDTAPTAPALGASRAPNLAAAPNAASHLIPEEYIVTFADSVKDVPGLAKQLAAQHGASVRFTYASALKGFAAHMSAQAAMALEKNPQIARLEQDRMLQRNDVQSTAPWHLDRVDQTALPLNGTYSYVQDGTGVNVYILDSGIRTTHREFGGRALGAYTAVNDGMGTDDCTGHGTMVASAAAGATFGVAKRATLWAVRVLDCSGSGATSGIIAGVDWITKNAQKPAVANMSLGGTTSSTLSTAVANSISAGIVYVTSAGNNATDACTQTPANVPAALTVASTTDADAQASWSNYGSCVDLFAPGINILAAWFSDDTITTRASGTSLSAPLVAGAAALYLQARPSALPGEVAQAIVSTATTGIVKSAGAGSPNLLLLTSALLSLPAGSPAPGTTSAPSTTPSTPVDQPPIARLTVNCSKSSCTFNGSASTDDHGIVSYAWHFGDGSASVSSTSSSVKYKYLVAGTYAATLLVTDTARQTSLARVSMTIKRL